MQSLHILPADVKRVIEEALSLGHPLLSIQRQTRTLLTVFRGLPQAFFRVYLAV